MQSATRARLDDLRVLVVDDDCDTRKLFSLSLTLHGATVVALGSAREALEAVARDAPDVILCDVVMPGMDGFAFLRELRAGPRGVTAPVVAVTGLGLHVADELRAAGFAAYCQKPCELELLADTIARLARPAGSGTSRPTGPA